MQGLMISMLYL